MMGKEPPDKEPDPIVDAIHALHRKAVERVRDRLAIDHQRRQAVLPVIRQIQADLASLQVKLGLMVPPGDRPGRMALFALCEASGLGDARDLAEQFEARKVESLRRHFHRSGQVEGFRQSLKARFVGCAADLASILGVNVDDPERALSCVVDETIGELDTVLGAVDSVASVEAALEVCGLIKDEIGTTDRNLGASVSEAIPRLRTSLTDLRKMLAAPHREGVPASKSGGPRQSIDDAIRTEFIRVLLAAGLDCEKVALILDFMDTPLPHDDGTTPGEAVAEYRDKVLKRSDRRRSSKVDAKPRRQPRQK